MFVVDDLVGWLIGRLADAGYQKLSTRFRGSDQARALKDAVTTAVEATVGEMGPSDPEEAERVAGQINKAFRRREPVPLPPGQPTLLEALQAGIAGQLSALDAAGQPAAGLWGVPVSEVAAKLTGHLVRQIQIRGSQPGPLTPLAGQLNDDLTHLQGQRLEGMLAQVLELLGPGLALPGGTAGPLGQPLAEVTNPFALEVHRPVEPDVPQLGLPVLPVYVPREHDAALAEVVTAAADGTSGIAVLVGGSSTGKTRACWQALDLLRQLEPGWRLWHPIDPQGALAGLPNVEPQTVVWLNEAQRYLNTADNTGERVAAGLRKLLRDPDRGPVLVLATLWLEFWHELTTRPPPKDTDPYAQARELLTGHDIPVPAKFADEQLRELQHADDPRLVQAATGSRDGQVIQYLAGAPELLDRYRTASPAARALIDAAMDAARLGMRGPLPRTFLEAAAPGYLTDTEWNLLPGNWLEEGLDYTKKAAKGVPGPLTPIRPRPNRGVPAAPDDELAWQLADYLYQYGRRTRQDQLGPTSLWDALTDHATSADDLTRLAWAARNRGLYRHATALWTSAVAAGRTDAAYQLVTHLHEVSPGDAIRAAQWAASRVSLDNPRAVGLLLRELRAAGADDAVTTLLARDPAARASLDDPGSVGLLLRELRAAGADDSVTTLLARDPAARASLGSPAEVRLLLQELRAAGADDAARTLADRAVARISLDDLLAVASLLAELRAAVNRPGVVISALLAPYPVGQASLDDPLVGGAARSLAGRAAARANLDDPGSVGLLLRELRAAGADDAVTTLLARDPAAQASLDDPRVAELLRELRAAGADDAARTLAGRAAAHASLDDPGSVGLLLRELRAAGADDAVTTLLARDPAAHASLDDPGSVGLLLRELRAAGADDAVTTLLARDPAAHASLDDPGSVGLLLRELRAAGADDAVTTLLARDPAAHASLDDPGSVGLLLQELRAAGADDAARTLAGRAADGGKFYLVLSSYPEQTSNYLFGREPDGAPSQSWNWQESESRSPRAD